MILWSLSKQKCSCVAFAEILHFLREKKEWLKVKLKRGEERKVVCLKTNK